MDLNDDGYADLISGSWPGDVYWYEGGTGGLGEQKVILEPKQADEIRYASAAFFVDWDRDGDFDMLVGNERGQVLWAENIGTPAEFEFGPRMAVEVQERLMNPVGRDTHPIAADWDNDGILDLLVGNDDGEVIFFRGVSHSQGSPPVLHESQPLLPKYTFGKRMKLMVHDWNEDGRMDLLIGNLDVDENGAAGYVLIMLRDRSFP